MDTLPVLAASHLYLFIHPHPRVYQQLFVLCAELAQRGPVLVLDGNNCFDAYRVAQLLRQQNADVMAALDRLRVARAFTCYQMISLIHNACTQCVSPAGPEPVFVLDFMAMFRDEDIPLPERRRVLSACLPDLRSVAQLAPVLICTRPADDPDLMEMLIHAADEVWTYAPDPEPPVLRLLPE